jgi:hypothetical protein
MPAQSRPPVWTLTCPDAAGPGWAGPGAGARLSGGWLSGRRSWPSYGAASTTRLGARRRPASRQTRCLPSSVRCRLGRGGRGLRVPVLSKLTPSLTLFHCIALRYAAAGMHKPNQQTVLCPVAVPGLLATLPLESLRSLGVWRAWHGMAWHGMACGVRSEGCDVMPACAWARGGPSYPGGKLGQRVKGDFNIHYAGELAGISRQALCRKYGDKTGAWLHLVARGEACEPVKDRLIPKSIGCVCVGWRSRSLVTWPWTVLPWRPNGAMRPTLYAQVQQDVPWPAGADDRPQGQPMAARAGQGARGGGCLMGRWPWHRPQTAGQAACVLIPGVYDHHFMACSVCTPTTRTTGASRPSCRLACTVCVVTK